LTNEELDAGLLALQQAGLIEALGEKFIPTTRVSAALPRTPRGAVSARADRWRRLYDRFLPE
jgi:hypothetical protein